VTAWLTGEDFDALFDNYEHTAFRLEVRESYLGVSYEPEPYRKFLAGEPDDGDWLKDWCNGVRARAHAGKTMCRVRVVSRPFSDYSRYGLYVCQRWNIPAGEDIRYLDRADAAGLPDHDFWLFDSQRLYVMLYDAQDAPLGAELIDDPIEIVQHNYYRDLAWHLATRPAEFPVSDAR
jgi:hypothetical protein